MTNTITLLHTAQVHVPRFDAIRDRIAPDVHLTHITRPDWLARAQTGIDADLAAEITAEIDAANGPVLCTCTTLGPVATGATRIDAPMMDAAAAIGGRICLALCLQSTAEASRALLQQAIDNAPLSSHIDVLLIPDAWAAFMDGDNAHYAAQITAAIESHLQNTPQTSTVLLGQASMDVAASRLAHLPIPVLTPAEAALQQVLANMANI